MNFGGGHDSTLYTSCVTSGKSLCASASSQQTRWGTGHTELWRGDHKPWEGPPPRVPARGWGLRLHS